MKTGREARDILTGIRQKLPPLLQMEGPRRDIRENEPVPDYWMQDWRIAESCAASDDNAEQIPAAEIARQLLLKKYPQAASLAGFDALTMDQRASLITWIYNLRYNQIRYFMIDDIAEFPTLGNKINSPFAFLFKNIRPASRLDVVPYLTRYMDVYTEGEKRGLPVTILLQYWTAALALLAGNSLMYLIRLAQHVPANMYPFNPVAHFIILIGSLLGIAVLSGRICRGWIPWHSEGMIRSLSLFLYVRHETAMADHREYTKHWERGVSKGKIRIDNKS